MSHQPALVKNGGDYYFTSGQPEVIDKLPVQWYSFENRKSGFFLTEMQAPNIGTVYGTEAITRKKNVLNSYGNHQTDTPFTVMMTGTKGSGKTLTANFIAAAALDKYNLPVIEFSNGVPEEECMAFSSYIRRLPFPCVLLFDEVDKNWKNNSFEVMLSILSGSVSSQKHLIFIIANDENKISEWIKSRPTRAHYWFKYSELSDDTLRYYINDNLQGTPAEAKIPGALDLCRNLEMITFDIVSVLVNKIKANPDTKPRELVNGMNIGKIGDRPHMVSIMHNGARIGQQQVPSCPFLRTSWDIDFTVYLDHDTRTPVKNNAEASSAYEAALHKLTKKLASEMSGKREPTADEFSIAKSKVLLKTDALPYIRDSVIKTLTRADIVSREIDTGICVYEIVTEYNTYLVVVQRAINDGSSIEYDFE